MPNAWTHYWSVDTCRREKEQGQQGCPLEHTAGELFAGRGVAKGDAVYVVNNRKGEMYLIGRLTVNEILPNAEAIARLGDDVWSASTHLLAKKNKCTPQSFCRKVPKSIVRRLHFYSQASSRPLKIHGEGLLDKQTLRGVRHLMPESALLLDRILSHD